MYRWVYVPTTIYLLYLLGDLIVTGWTGADWGDTDFFEIWKAVNTGSSKTFGLDKNVYEQLPEWYKVMKSFGIFYLTPPVIDLGFLGVAIKEAKSEGKFETGPEKTKRLANESYNKSLENANKQALIKYNSMSSEEKQELQSSALLPAIKIQLENPSYYLPFLTPEEAKFVLSRLEFKPSIPLTARATISQKIGKLDLENATEAQTVELDNTNLTIVGNVILKGNDGEYLAIPASRNSDPDGIRDKTNNPNIKGYWAWVKPKFNELKIGTSRKYYDLKEFVEENK
jgi:hypothetical protein